MSNNAIMATQDGAVVRQGRIYGFSREWTRRAVALLRTVAHNPFVKQARGTFGSLNANGHGAVCANQVLIELLDNLRNTPNPRGTIDRILPVSSSEIIDWNDAQSLSFEQIAAKIEQAAGPALYAD